MPPGWTVSDACASSRSSGVDGHLTVLGPDGRSARLQVETCQAPDPRWAHNLGDRLRGAPLDHPVLVVSPYLTPAVRGILEEAGVGYLDLTGNIRIAISEPGLCIQAVGANRRPGRKERPARSLGGLKAGHVIRSLCDYRSPLGVRELAARAGVDPGYVSRVLRFLDSQALVDRGPRGRVIRSHWRKLLERWAEDAPLEKRGEHRWLLAPRGISHLKALLADWRRPYVISGSVAAYALAPSVPPRSLVLYVEDADQAMSDLELREVSTGANVDLVEVIDRLPFERGREQDGLLLAAPSQVAVDLLGSGDRGPQEAEALLNWMATHEEAWRG